LWQRVAASPLRRTQTGGFFKRDLERLTQDPLINEPPADSLAALPDPAMPAAALGESAGIGNNTESELRAAGLPPAWERGLYPALADLWASWPHVVTWDPLAGWRDGEPGRGNPFPSAYLLALLLVARLPDEAWVDPADVETWVMENHPYWKSE